MPAPSAPVPTRAPPGRGLHITLWVVQAILALVFLVAGVMRIVMPIPELLKFNVWVSWVSEAQVRLIGVVEALGGLGLILPSATRIMPKLSGIAAVGLVILMVGATSMHFMHDDAMNAQPAIVLAVLCAFIAWGRLTKAQIAQRG